MAFLYVLGSTMRNGWYDYSVVPVPCPLKTSMLRTPFVIAQTNDSQNNDYNRDWSTCSLCSGLDSSRNDEYDNYAAQGTVSFKTANVG